MRRCGGMIARFSVVVPVATVWRIINSWRCLLHLIRVLPDTRRPIGSGPAIESLPASLQVLVAAMPGLQSRIMAKYKAWVADKGMPDKPDAG
jgi:hypothetical protein